MLYEQLTIPTLSSPSGFIPVKVLKNLFICKGLVKKALCLNLANTPFYSLKRWFQLKAYKKGLFQTYLEDMDILVSSIRYRNVQSDTHCSDDNYLLYSHFTNRKQLQQESFNPHYKGEQNRTERRDLTITSGNSKNQIPENRTGSKKGVQCFNTEKPLLIPYFLTRKSIATVLTNC